MNPQNEKPTEQQANDVAGVVDDVTALNAAFPAQNERRQVPRLKYQVVATLEPVAVGPDDVRVVTRDADSKGTGFVSSGPMEEGSRAVLHLPAPEGQPDAEPQRIECRVRRSREIGNGLFEGSVEFVGEQPQFSDTRIKPTLARRR
jgi:PilZ domain-containing protein